MAYLTATGTNESLLGAIKIVSVKHAEAPLDATDVKVSRRDMSGATWTVLTTFEIASVDGLTFSFLDRNVLTGHTYRYAIVPIVGEVEQTAVNVDVLCSFNAIFVCDTTGI